MNIYEIAALERKLHRFLSYIPDDSPLWHFYYPETGNHSFVNSDGFMERLNLSKDEWKYLLAQHRIFDSTR